MSTDAPESYTPRSTRLSDLSWPEIREALDAGWDTVVVAAGSIEQHGPHLPLLTDTLIGDGLGAAVVSRLSRTLQGPTISLGCSEHHMAFPGTITMEKATFVAVACDYARSLARHGFRYVCFVPSHGGNFGPLREAVDSLGGRIGETTVATFSDLFEFVDVLNGSQLPFDVTAERAGAHAGETETALVMHLRPDLVLADKFEEGYVGPFGVEQSEIIFRDGMTALTPNGILGDARGAEAEFGVAALDAVANYLATWVERVRAGSAQ